MREYVSSAVTHQNLSMCIVVLLVSCVLATAQREKVLYAFGANSADGAGPSGGLIADAAGNLYGTTGIGGASNAGTVYEMSPSTPNNPWTETILYAFGGSQDGADPSGSLVFDTAGNLYGTTFFGGSQDCEFGCGTIFELSPPTVQGGSWTKTTIYSFSGGSDGAYPAAGLVFDKAGNLYSTAALGGGTGSCSELAPGCGTVFELSPPAAPGGTWTETVLYSFTGGSDGGSPGAPVVFDKAGNLYGTAAGGGNPTCEGGCGTVFELTPSGEGTWTETVLHSFSSFSGDGFNPQSAGLITDKSGALAGTTVEGGAYGFGTVFGLLPPSSSGRKWAYGVVYSFGASQTDGLNPVSGVILVNGMLYGTTPDGGSNAVGTVFQLARTKGGVWKETGLYSFKGGSDGEVPQGGLLLGGGVLYGTTTAGGSKANAGTVFRIGP